MNIAPLRRTIFKEGGFFLALLAVFGGATFYLGTLYDEFTTKKNIALSAVSQTVAEKQKIEAQFTTVKDNMPVYYESMQYDELQGLFIDSQAVRDLFNLYQSRYFFKKMSVEMQPIADIAGDPKYVRPHFVATRTNAKVIIEALSDEDIYQMLQMMQRELPGFVRINSLTLAKSQELSKDVLMVVRKEGTFPMIVSEVVFDWYGMKSTDVASKLNKYVPKNRAGAAP